MITPRHSLYVLLICNLFFLGCGKMESRMHSVQSHAAYEKGDYKKAIELAEKSVSTAKQNLGLKHPETLVYMNNLAYLYSTEGRFDDAEKLHLTTYELRKEVYGEDHQDTLTSMNNLGHVYQRQGKFEKARVTFQETLRKRQQLLGDKDLQTLNVMSNLAESYLVTGDIPKARGLYEKIYETGREVFGEHHKVTISGMKGVAEAHFLQAEYAEAASLYSKVLELEKMHLGEHQPVTLLSMSNLARVFQAQGRYDQAERLFVIVLEGQKAGLGTRHPDTLAGMNNLALLYLNQGNIPLAESLLTESFSLHGDVLGKTHPKTLVVMDNLATVLRESGKYEQAEKMLRETIQLKSATFSETHASTLGSMNNLALLYQAMGHYDRAESLYVEILAQRTKNLGERNVDTAASLNNLAYLYSHQGRFSQAEDVYTRALNILNELLGENHPDTLKTRANMAALYMDQGDYANAKQQITDILQRSRTVLGENHPDTIRSLNDLGVLYSKFDDYKQAHTIGLEVVERLEEIYGPDHPETMKAMNNLAFIYQSLGWLDKAEALYNKALDLRLKNLGELHPDTLLSRINLAELYLSVNKYDLAFIQLQRHLDTSNTYLRQLLWGAGETTRKSYIAQENDSRNLYLSLFSNLSTPEAIAEFWKVSLTRKGLLLSIASEIKRLAMLQEGDDPELKNNITQFNTIRTELATLTFSDQNSKTRRETLQELLNEFERKISLQVHNESRLQAALRPENILKVLTNNQVIVDYLIFRQVELRKLDYLEEKIVAVIASPHEPIRLVDLGAVEPIADAVNRYRKAIEPWSGGSDWFYTKERQQLLDQTAQELYDKLWQPLEPHIVGKKEVLLIPDGILHLLPFKSLKDHSGEYLLNRYTITRLSSARELVRPAKSTAPGASVVFSNPRYGKSAVATDDANRSVARNISDLQFADLPGTKTEGETILSLMRLHNKKALLYTDAAAKEAQLNRVNSPFILHLATHGFYLENIQSKNNLPAKRALQVLDSGKLALTNVENPLARSGLALAYANEGVRGTLQPDGTDGVISALEVLGLNLAGTEMVALSACDTGVGEVQTGEGVYSLNRAFQEAGAQTVLSTLWSISDEATNEFMQVLYKKILDTLPPQQALQLSQQELQKSSDWYDPFFWAAFVMVGDTRAAQQ